MRLNNSLDKHGRDCYVFQFLMVNDSPIGTPQLFNHLNMHNMSNIKNPGGVGGWGAEDYQSQTTPDMQQKLIKQPNGFSVVKIKFFVQVLHSCLQLHT